MKSLILAGAELQINQELLNIAKDTDLIVAADSGLKHAQALNVLPSVIIGDFDSIDSNTLAKYPNIKKITYPKKKDFLDFELALQYVTKLGSDDITVFGASGGRLDQTVAAILIAAKLARKHRISLHSGKQDIYFLAGSDSLGLELNPGSTFSIISLSEAATISLKGAEYELDKSKLEFGVGKGVSNTAKDSVLKISLHDGLITIIVEKEI